MIIILLEVTVVTKQAKFIVFIILSLLIVFMSACSEKDGSGYLFRYSLLGNPKNLDPQLATDTSSLVVIQNMYCGLLRTTGNGKLTEGAAKKYTISPDYLKYTFDLREDLYWKNADSDFKEQVTANDFVFAFKRIFEKNTKSPYAESFSCIKNAEKIITGELGADSIGVTAKGDFELEIDLDYPNANFLSLMTTSAAMPCNEEFFNNSKGKYGLETDSTISDGAFYLKEWEYDPYGQNNYIIMRPNKYFSEFSKIYPSSLNFFIEKDSKKIAADFKSNSTDFIVTDEAEKNLFASGYTINGYETTSCGLIYNTKSEIFSNLNLRQALSLAIDRSEYEGKLSNGARPAYAIVPSGISMLNKSYRELVSEKDKSPYNLTVAQEKWKQGLSEYGKLSIDTVKILIPKSFNNQEWLKYITQQWQNKFDFFCGIEVVPDEKYAARIANGDYQIALYQLSCEYNNPESILSNFETGNIKNVISYSNPKFDELINESSKVQTLSESVKIYSEAEKLIIDDYIYTPIFYQKEFLVYKDTITDIEYNPFTKQFDFSNAKNFK